jgi:hypothetical protein
MLAGSAETFSLMGGGQQPLKHFQTKNLRYGLKASSLLTMIGSIWNAAKRIKKVCVASRKSSADKESLANLTISLCIMMNECGEGIEKE